MKDKLLTGFLGAAALSALLLTSCADYDTYTNESLVIATYTYDDWLDPTRGESLVTYKDNNILLLGNLGEIVEKLTIKANVSIYMDNVVTSYAEIGGNLSMKTNQSEGTWTLYSGTMENGVIHINGSLGKIALLNIDFGNDWYVQVIDGKTMVSVAAPHNEWLKNTTNLNSANTAKATSLMAIADTAAEDYVDTKDYTGLAYTTVTFPGDADCIQPNIRYMTCVIHGNQVKALMKLGRNEDNTATGEVKAVFKLPEASEESGTIEFTTIDSNNQHTYEATWARKRRDVRISEIKVKDSGTAAAK